MPNASIRPEEPSFTEEEEASGLSLPGLAGPSDRRRLSGPALRAFSAIARGWRLGEPERLRILGSPARSTYHGWMAKARAGEGVSLPLDTLLRLSAVLGIWKAMRILFEEEETAMAWLRSENHGPLFGGQAPIELLASGTQDGLLQLRRHLDAWRGGAFAPPMEGEPEERLRPGDLVIS
jgi:hypothetical protein